MFKTYYQGSCAASIDMPFPQAVAGPWQRMRCEQVSQLSIVLLDCGVRINHSLRNSVPKAKARQAKLVVLGSISVHNMAVDSLMHT